MTADTPNLETWPTRVAKSRVVASVTVPGPPASKARARFRSGKNGRVQVYTPSGAASAQESVAWQLKAARRLLDVNGESAFGIRCAFRMPGLQRTDLDNLMKLVWDAATGVIWEDDSQVVEAFSCLARDSRDVGTDIIIYTLGPLTTREIKCQRCRKAFRTYPSWRYKSHCSRACFHAANLTGQTFACAGCGKSIYRAPHQLTTREKYCTPECHYRSKSRESQCPHCLKVFRVATTRRVGKHEFCTRDCAIAYLRAHPAQRGPKQCAGCEARVSRRNYEYCRACRMERTSPPVSNYWTRTPV